MGVLEVRQATTVTFQIGEFVTSDGTAVTGLTISVADVRLSFNGAAAVAKAQTTTCTHDADGWYDCILGPTDTSALGFIQLRVNKTGSLPVWKDLEVVTTNYWDTKYASDSFDVNLNADQSAVTIGIVQSLTTVGTVGTVQSLSTVGTVQSLSTVGAVTGGAQASAVATIAAKFPISVVTTVQSLSSIATVHSLSTVGAVTGGAQASAIAALNDIAAADVWSDASGTSVYNTVNAIDTNYAQASAIAALNDIAAADIWSNVSGASVLNTVNNLETNYAQASAVTTINNNFPLSVVSTVTDGAQASTVAGVAQASAIAALNDISVADVAAQALSATVAIGPAKNVALGNFPIFLKKSTDHITPLSSVAPVGYIIKDGAAITSISTAIAASNSYGICIASFTQAEMNGDRIAFIFTAAGADQIDIVMITT